MQRSAVLTGLQTYPFARLDEAKRRAAAQGLRVIDFGQGDPREPTDPLVREALAAAIRETMGYPLAAGLPELREAIARWCGRRFGAGVDPDREVIPTLGSKEAIFTLAQAVLGEKRLVVTTEPGYPVPARGALFAGGELLAVPLREETGFLPDLGAIGQETWERIGLFWVNYPNNPTGATAPLAFYEELAERARRHDFVLASDEAYSEIWFDEPPASALQVPDRTNVAVFNTLSKRSSMTGYRSGFVAGDPELVAALRAFRPNVGTAPQEFVQRASIAAWDDEAHVERTRDVYRRKRAIVEPALRARGIRVAGGAATFFLWLAVPAGETSEGFAERLLAAGIVVTPGSYLGPAGEGYARLALVPDEEECRRAAAILQEAL